MGEPSPQIEALKRNVQTTFTQIIEQVPYLPEELQVAVTNVEDPSELGWMIAGALRIGAEEKQALLEERDVAKRLRKLSELLAREAELISIGAHIQSQVQYEMEKGQREYFLRQQLKAIQEELGEVDEQQAEANELREQIEAANLPEVVLKQTERELQRFERLPPQSAEHGIIRTYLEWIVELPWDKPTEDKLDLRAARRQLDRDHYDIDKIKERIIEFLAVRKLKPDARSGILCFVGPPGVGKTSLGKSIAAAMGREFERISVGGVRDESEIRGHRRTYIGAMPGVIIRAMRDAGSSNPVLMIDEIDKMGSDFRGDPSSAMLEVLDPEQNTSFRDHYLDLPFDLSKVMFVCTANQLETIPVPLRDRMELIELSGYTEEQKLEIAKRYLVPRQIERNGLTPGKVELTDTALELIIEGYTREAGVRELEREIGSVCRKVAREFAEGKRTRKRAVGPRVVVDLLGKRKVQPEVRAAHRHRGRRHRARLDAGRRRRAVRRGDRLPGRGQAADHGPARRRDEGVGVGGALLPEGQRVALGAHGRPRVVPRARPARARARRRGAEGRAERGHHDGDRAGLADHRTARALRHRDDRRDHADGQGAADRRAQGEGAGGAARGDHARDRAEAERGRLRRVPAVAEEERRVLLGRADRPGAARGARARGRPSAGPTSRPRRASGRVAASGRDR